MLLGVPNFSEGRDPSRIAALRSALDERAIVLDRHSDRDHHRTVFTIAGEPQPLARALVAGAVEAVDQIDMTRHRGLHPCIGALDVCPVVWLDPADREVAHVEAHAIAGAIGELGIPVFFYGDLAGSDERRERAYFRRGGLDELGRRMASGKLRQDKGPNRPHPTAGATLVTARPPLGAFNVELAGGDLGTARRIAAALREDGGGLPGVRAIGLELDNGRAQVSTNIHDPVAVPLGDVVERIRELAAAEGTVPDEGELVGLIPEAGLVGYPSDVPIRGLNRENRVIERRLASLG